MVKDIGWLSALLELCIRKSWSMIACILLFLRWQRHKWQVFSQQKSQTSRPNLWTYRCNLVHLIVAFLPSHMQQLSVSAYPLESSPLINHRCGHTCKSAWKKEKWLFPIKRTRRVTAGKAKSLNTFGVYCSCRMPDLPGTHWIQCSQCKEWFHLNSCIVVEKQALNPNVAWCCKNCVC